MLHRPSPNRSGRVREGRNVCTARQRYCALLVVAIRRNLGIDSLGGEQRVFCIWQTLGAAEVDEEEQMQEINLCCSGPAPDYFFPSSPPSRRSASFSTGLAPSLGCAASAPGLSTSPRMSLTSMPSNGPHSGSWPLPRIGHGTPINRGRRSAWAGNGSTGVEEADEVTESGVLFSTVPSTSIDSSHSTPQPSQRSILILACGETLTMGQAVK
ncbi:hypothetical protein B0H14DRAFT_3584931 [Mycena olivaceomarginata]|nr:hypothetical protein B0H14DRAFT_3584931 [Mycena olivaceomarginata]